MMNFIDLQGEPGKMGKDGRPGETGEPVSKMEMFTMSLISTRNCLFLERFDSIM